MTVKELIETLQKFPQDSIVVGYNGRVEDDHLIKDIELVYPEVETWDDEEYYYPPYYCQGNSVARDYWNEHGSDKPIVLLKEPY